MSKSIKTRPWKQQNNKLQATKGSKWITQELKAYLSRYLIYFLALDIFMCQISIFLHAYKELNTFLMLYMPKSNVFVHDCRQVRHNLHRDLFLGFLLDNPLRLVYSAWGWGLCTDSWFDLLLIGDATYLKSVIVPINY